VDPSYSKLVVFNHKNYTPLLPAQLAFIIQVIACRKNINHFIVDEGASTYIMFMSCWKVIGSPQLSQSPPTLKDFYGRIYKPCGILNSLQVELVGKNVSIEVEVINGPIDYNILLG